MYEEVIAKREKIFGANHPSSLRTRNDLALVYVEQGEYKKAQVLLERVIVESEKVLKEGHPDILKSKNSLGLVFHHQSKYERCTAFIGGSNGEKQKEIWKHTYGNFEE